MLLFFITPWSIRVLLSEANLSKIKLLKHLLASYVVVVVSCFVYTQCKSVEGNYLGGIMYIVLLREKHF